MLLLDTFSDRFLAQLLCHLDYRPADVVGCNAATDAVDKGLVNFDNVERHLLQVTQ